MLTVAGLLVFLVLGVKVGAVGPRLKYWLGVPLVVFGGWYLISEYQAGAQERAAVSVVSHAVSVIDMGEPERASNRNSACVKAWSEDPTDIQCVDPGYPAWATAVYPVEGRGPVEVIDVVYERLIAAGYRLTWGPYCRLSSGRFEAVFRTPEGYGVAVSSSGSMRGPSDESEMPWGLKVRVTVDIESGQPLPPDEYGSGPEPSLERCGPGS